ncbi:MAG: hypothetical protein FJX77_03900 [Armatimonadetes bacterium]|nr:hypothetical protein [Armatimonadota bacterium]
MQRLNFTLDDETVRLLEKLAEKYYHGNKSQTVRSALESLAAHAGHEGWVVAGYSPLIVDQPTSCHTCGDSRPQGDILYRPVFQRGEGPRALPRLPHENWLDCSNCVEQSVAS